MKIVTRSKAIEIMMQLKVEYYYAFKDMPDDLFAAKIDNFQKMLDGYSDKEIDIALGFVLKENKSVPTIAHFIDVLDKNRELLLPTPEEEWANICAVNQKLDEVFDKYKNPRYEWEQLRKEANEIYLSLSEDVRLFYINYSGFLEVRTGKKEIKQAQFLKSFATFRKERRRRSELKNAIK